MNNRDSHIIAFVGTILMMVLLFLLLWFVYLQVPQPENEEGVEVAFGEVPEAGGYESVESEAVPLPAPTPSAPQVTPSRQDLLTQEDEAALALQRQKEKEARERKAAEEAERKAREKAAAEKKAKEDAAIAKANQMGSLFGNSGSATGSGDSEGAGQKGNPVGHGSSGGNSWSLEGRNIRGGMPAPSNAFVQEGKVVVSIRVNAAGEVIEATVTGGNISDKATQQLALDAARKTKFSESDKPLQVGTLTYNFKFK